MNPQEKVNNEFRYVLNRIRELDLKTKNNNPIDYWIYFDVAGGEISNKTEQLILEKLEELGAIKILNPGGSDEYE